MLTLTGSLWCKKCKHSVKLSQRSQKPARPAVNRLQPEQTGLIKECLCRTYHLDFYTLL